MIKNKSGDWLINPKFDMKKMYALSFGLLLCITTVKPVYNTLSEHCGYGTMQEAEAAYQSSLTDQKRCHFVDEEESGTYLHWIGMDQVEICYKVVGW